MSDPIRDRLENWVENALNPQDCADALRAVLDLCDAADAGVGSDDCPCPDEIRVAIAIALGLTP